MFFSEEKGLLTEIPDLKDMCKQLVSNHFLMQSKSTTTVCDHPLDKPDYAFPELDVKKLIKKLKDDRVNPGDRKIYWKVNFDTFTQDLRYDYIF